LSYRILLGLPVRNWADARTSVISNGLVTDWRFVGSLPRERGQPGGARSIKYADAATLRLLPPASGGDGMAALLQQTL
jgi:hypothetical protein